MRIGTTPTHIFELPPELAGTVAKLRAVYVQRGSTVLTKETDKLDGNAAVFKLTQEETLQFYCHAPVSVQVRVLTLGGDALTSDPMTVSCTQCLEHEVLA